VTRVLGTVRRVLLARGYGFVLGDDGTEYFLQADDFLGEWSGALVRAGARVEFVPIQTGRGPRALEARPSPPGSWSGAPS